MLARPEIGTREHVKLWLAGKPRDEVVWWCRNGFQCACDQYYIENYGVDTLEARNWAGQSWHRFPIIHRLNLLARNIATDRGPAPVPLVPNADYNATLYLTWGELYDAVCSEWQ